MPLEFTHSTDAHQIYRHVLGLGQWRHISMELRNLELASVCGKFWKKWCSWALLDREKCFLFKGKGSPVCVNLQQGLKENLSFCDSFSLQNL